MCRAARRDYKEYLKSSVADIAMSEAGGAPVTAASPQGVRRRYALDPPGHSGTAWLDESKPYLAKGPTACLFALCASGHDWKD